MLGASLVAETVKNLPEMLETQVRSQGWEISWRREWQPTPVFLLGEFQKRSLEGYSPWGHKESVTTEQLTHSIAKIGFCGFCSEVRNSAGRALASCSCQPHCEKALSSM